MQLINNTHYTHYQCQLHHFSLNDVINQFMMQLKYLMQIPKKTKIAGNL